MSTKSARVTLIFRAAVACLFVLAVGSTATLTLAQTRKPPPRGRPAAPARAHKPAASSEAAGPGAHAKGDAGEGDLVAQKTLDGGTKVFRFGELEIEGRLKNPQLVFFLRRVRAEFAAGDLGHRSFMRELGETKLDPNF